MIVFRIVWVLLALALLRSAAFGQDAGGGADWAKYCERFLTPDGRVLDTGNQRVSHTEGQGSAMLLAEAYNDRPVFDRVWNWTRNTLQRHDNALFSWKWDPEESKNQIVDRNDASDGDILIAWALSRAARHWKDPNYAHAAERILADIRRKLIVDVSGRSVLLPGFTGFRTSDGNTIVNPSYYIYPAFNEFARSAAPLPWQRLRKDGLALAADARFGRWGLPPDWVDVSDEGGITPAPNYPPRFGFDAVRIPLYLIWAGEGTPERLASYLDFWNGFGDRPIPAWADLKDNTVAPYAGSNGFQAIIRLVRTFRDPNPPPLPSISDQDDYYSASLLLLAGVVRREAPR